MGIKKNPEAEKLKIRKINLDEISLTQTIDELRTDRSSSAINIKLLNTSVYQNTSQILVASTGNIRVVCRFRPLNEKEKTLSQGLCVDFLDYQTCAIKSSVLLLIIKAENNSYNFNFDRIFDVNSHQKDVYEYSAKSIIDSK